MFDPGTWAVHEFTADITNDAGAAGNHVYNFTPGEGNIGILLGGQLANDDASARNGQVLLRDADNAIIRRVLFLSSIAAGAERQFPTREATADDASADSGMPVVISGVQDLNVSLDSVAASQDSALSISFLMLNGPMTVTITSPASAVETITTNRMI